MEVPSIMGKIQCHFCEDFAVLTKACSDVVAEVQKYLDVHEQVKV